jgi:hypothetical protein
MARIVPVRNNGLWHGPEPSDGSFTIRANATTYNSCYKCWYTEQAQRSELGCASPTVGQIVRR